MSTSTPHATFRVALIGNPNTGKSTLFSALVGVHQHVGNYPGVTVEKKTGWMEHGGNRFEVIDLPGLYSLAPRSLDEMVAVDTLLGRSETPEPARRWRLSLSSGCGGGGGGACHRRRCRSKFSGGPSPPVDAVVCIVDAANLQRSFYLVSQVLELGLPTVVAVNMLDVAKRHGTTIDFARLRRQLPVPVVAIQANRRIGIAALKTALANAIRRGPTPVESPFPDAFEQEVVQLESLLGQAARGDKAVLPRCLVRRLLLDSDGFFEQTLPSAVSGPLGDRLKAARVRLAAANCPVPAIETTVRYAWAGGVLEGVVGLADQGRVTFTDRIDRVLTHRLWGMLVFAAVMAVVFQSIFVWARPAMEMIDDAAKAAAQWLSASMPQGALESLLADGVIGGVGGVLSFLPQILVLFFFVAVLEDCGYMARAAYLMDKLMVRAGLSGKSFIPMLSCFACAVPGIMAARVIENERDRLTTILVAPLMTCSARLPIYTLLIAAFIPPRTFLGGVLSLQGLTMAALYLLGIVTAVIVAWLLKKSVLRGVAPPFLLELPSYKWPSPRTVLHRVLQRGWVFVRTAGTLILVISVLVWAALYFPHHGDQRRSFLGALGQTIEPIVKPLGWDWRIGCAVLASLPAREVVVATMGVMYSSGENVDVESAEGVTQLQAELRAATWDQSREPVFNIPVALSILVFFALCAQCAATLAVIRRETNSWRWPAFTFGYMTSLAYLGALVTYQVGMLI